MNRTSLRMLKCDHNTLPKPSDEDASRGGWQSVTRFKIVILFAVVVVLSACRVSRVSVEMLRWYGIRSGINISLYALSPRSDYVALREVNLRVSSQSDMILEVLADKTMDLILLALRQKFCLPVWSAVRDVGKILIYTNIWIIQFAPKKSCHRHFDLRIQIWTSNFKPRSSRSQTIGLDRIGPSGVSAESIPAGR